MVLGKMRELMSCLIDTVSSFLSIFVTMRKSRPSVASCLEFSRKLGSVNFYVKYLDFEMSTKVCIFKIP